MKIETRLKRRLLAKNKSHYLKLRKIERWYQYVEPDVEFFLYEDFKESSPSYTFFKLDILNDTKCVFSKSDKNFNQLVNYVASVTKKVSDVYYERRINGK